MDLTQLEMFNAVALTGSITQAAQKVHRVPSNLTTRIRQLEADLGVELFIRENQRLRLSPAGHNFLRYSKQILALVDEARMVVAGDEPQGLFALGALESTAAVRIPESLAQFNQRYPRIQFALSTGPSGTMIDGVLEGTLSAAFVDGPLSHPELEGMPVYREEMMLVTPAGHAEVARATQVSGSDVYAFRANCSYRRHLESWFHADRATPGRIHEMESYHGMLACVIAGAGIALMPRSMLESMPGHHQVEAWPLAENWRWLTTWLVWRRGAMTRPLEAFIALLNERQPPCLLHKQAQRVINIRRKRRTLLIAALLIQTDGGMLPDARFQAKRVAVTAQGFIFQRRQQHLAEMLPAMSRIDIHPFHFTGPVAVEHHGTTPDGMKLPVPNNHQDQRGCRQFGQIEQVVTFSGIEFALIAVKRGNQMQNIRVMCRFSGNGIHGGLLVVFIST